MLQSRRILIYVCYLLGKYRGAACNQCNLLLVERQTVKVFLHNLCGFDSHLIANEFVSKKWDLKAVPINSEQCKMLKFGCYELLDSYSFQSQSLGILSEKLISEKKAKGEQLEFLAQCEVLCYTSGVFDQEKYDCCILGKALFPYLAATSIDALRGMSSYPEIEAFRSSLTGEDVDKEAYENGKRVFKLMKFENMAKYYEWYCVLDSMLLAEIMWDFKNRCQTHFNLSPDAYWTLPSYALDACLKVTKARIELVVDMDIYNFIEGAKRGTRFRTFVLHDGIYFTFHVLCIGGFTAAVTRLATTGPGRAHLSGPAGHKYFQERLDEIGQKLRSMSHEEIILDM